MCLCYYAGVKPGTVIVSENVVDSLHRPYFELVRVYIRLYRTTVCRYNWHTVRSLGWPFPMLKYKYRVGQKAGPQSHEHNSDGFTGGSFVNLQLNGYYKSHRTLHMLLHFLVKH